MNGQPSLLNIKALTIDMDGVLWQGDEVFPGFIEFFNFLRRENIPFTLATNNASKTQDQYVQKFARLGVTIHREEVMTSSLATAEYLKGQYPPGSRFFIIGQDGLRQALTSAGFIIADKDVEAVIVGIDLELTYQKLKRGVLLVNGGARFIGSNPDVTLPCEEGLAPGNGAILAAVSAATGQTPITIGKPGAIMFELAIKRMGVTPAETAMLGDRLETDILGAQQAGLKSILVLTGVTTPEMLATRNIKPDWVFENIATLTTAWENAYAGGN